MSNHPSNKEQNAVFQQSENQRNPGLAKPTDFTITSAADAADAELAGHGQHGRTSAEKRQLLAERDADGKSKPGKPIPERPNVDRA